MKVGLLVPVFEHDARAALDTARRAEAAGLDGVFAYDHLWPLRQPGRPALSPLPTLGAVAASTTTIHIGTLVARVGMLPNGMLVAALASLSAISGGRLVAGLGTGDRQSAPEQLAYDLPYRLAGERRASLTWCAAELAAAGIPVWVGDGTRATRAAGRLAGAAVNVWGLGPAPVAAEAGHGEVTWGGPVGTDPGEVAAQLGSLSEAGATWAVCHTAMAVEELARAADALG